MALRSRGLLLALVLQGIAGQAMAQDARAHAEAYRACPAGGAAFWMLEPRAAPSPPGRPDLLVVEGGGIDVRLVGDGDWIAPPAAPEELMLDRRTWLRPVSMVRRHQTLREASRRTLLRGRPRILLAERTEHWASLWESTVAVRADSGVWNIDYVRRYDDGTAELEQWTLDARASRRLDDLIADPCLAREPFQSDYAYIQSSDNTRWTLEVETTDSTVRISGRDSGFGRAGAINFLLHGGSAE